MIRLAALFWLLTATVAHAKTEWMVKATELALEEKQVIEAMFPDQRATSFWISVRDDGTDRSGFASYVCLLLYDAGMPVGLRTIISVWDLPVEKKIGRFVCERK